MNSTVERKAAHNQHPKEKMAAPTCNTKVCVAPSCSPMSLSAALAGADSNTPVKAASTRGSGSATSLPTGMCSFTAFHTSHKARCTWVPTWEEVASTGDSNFCDKASLACLRTSRAAVAAAEATRCWGFGWSSSSSPSRAPADSLKESFNKLLPGNLPRPRLGCPTADGLALAGLCGDLSTSSSDSRRSSHDWTRAGDAISPRCGVKHVSTRQERGTQKTISLTGFQKQTVTFVGAQIS